VTVVVERTDWHPYDQERPPEGERGGWWSGEAVAARKDGEAKPSKRTERRSQKGDGDAPRHAERPEGEEGEGDAPEREEHDEKEQREHGRSDVDATGQDKHREVIGQQYGINKGRQFVYYAIFLVCVALAFIGLRQLATSLDKAPTHDPDKAPWSRPNAPQEPLGGFAPHKSGHKGPVRFQ
jgi:hypothetical protein